MVAAVIGQNYTCTCTFKNQDGTPFEVVSPISYKVFAFNDALITENTATQDLENASIWYANFAIPENAPVPNDVNNEQYRIDWYAQGINERLQATQQFQVIGSAEPPVYDSTVLAMVGQPIEDTLITELPLQSYSLKIQDFGGNVLYTYTNPNPKSILRNNAYITSYSSGTAISNVTDKCMGYCPYIMTYEFTTTNGESQIEIHMLYIINSIAAILINNMRRYLDMARNYDLDVNLRLTEEDYIHFITVGLQRINGANPNTTTYTLCNFPTGFLYLLEKCAEVELLNAWYLAEGMRSFEFTGASVSLSVKRTEFIEKKMDEINSWLDNNLEKQKELMIRKGNSAGNLGIQMSSVMNGYSFRAPGQLRGLFRRW